MQILAEIGIANQQVILMMFLCSFAACTLTIMVFVEKEVMKHKKRIRER